MQAKEDKAHYELQGKSLAFVSTPASVYLGVPELWCLTSGKKIDAPLLAKAINSQAAWLPLSNKQQGVYELVLEDDQGNRLFHQVCALLPEDFSICYLPIAKRIDISHIGSAYVSCDSPLISHITASGSGRSIECTTHHTDVASVDVVLRWTGTDNRLTITVPFAKYNHQEQLNVLHDDSSLLSARIEQLNDIIQRRDQLSIPLITELKRLNTKIQALRAELKISSF